MERSSLYKSKVLEICNPETWEEHRYGLTERRWVGLRDKVFWITGAGTGFGCSISCALAAAGASVIMSGRRLEALEKARSYIASLKIPTQSCDLLPLDVTNEQQVYEACKTIEDKYMVLNGLINNAAVALPPDMNKPLENGDITLWDQIINCNLKAPWLVTRYGWPLLLKSASPRVVFITSEAGWAGASGMGIYNVSKAGLNNLCFSLAMELKYSYPDIDVQINAVVPGVAKTEMNPFGSDSPSTIVSIVLALLSHAIGGPNGKFFHRDGGHIKYGYSKAYTRSL